MINTMKNLFSKSMSKKKMAIFITSFIVFVASLGFFAYEGTKKTVALTIDGQEQVIRTHASTIEDILIDLQIDVRSEDYLYPSANTKVENDLKVVWEPAKQVTIVTDGVEHSVWTTAETVQELLKAQKLELTNNDLVQPDLQTVIKNRMKIAVKLAFPLTLVDGGKEQQVWSTSTTVADFLEQQGITLGELDRVEPAQEMTIEKDAVVNVTRVEKVTDVVEEPKDYKTVTKNDANLAKGTKKVVQKGKEGIVSKEFSVVKENGKEISRELISEKVVKEPTDKIVAVGTKVLTKQVSRGSVEGETFYVSSTAYTAYCNGCSGTTATGINLRANPGLKVIAVDPRVIPLGTKVYVEGYGYAVAADTGSAIQGNKIDVFFPTKSEAYRWGRKSVKITILK